MVLTASRWTGLRSFKVSGSRLQVTGDLVLNFSFPLFIEEGVRGEVEGDREQVELVLNYSFPLLIGGGGRGRWHRRRRV
jgi:hypothetical protein